MATVRVLRLCLRALVLLLLGVAACWHLHPEAEANRGVVDGRRQGQDPTLEVHRAQACAQEIVEDMDRAVRFVRHRAAAHGVDSRRLAVTSGSSGGHLSLMLANCGGTGGPPDSFKKSFGPTAAELAQWQRMGREISPIFHEGKRFPPMLIAHGDADTLLPLEQSERFREQAARFGHNIRILLRRAARHGGLTMPWDIRTFALWVNEHFAFL